MSSNAQSDLPCESFDGQDETWQPILDGNMREHALEVVREIALSLRTPPRAIVTFGFEDAKYKAATEASLGTGVAGLAVLYAYLDQAEIGDDHDRTVARFVQRAIEAINTGLLWTSLYGGFTGVAWITAHLRGSLLDSDGEDPNEDLDNYLKQYLESRSPWNRTYDLIGGLVGIGVYALERVPHPVAVKCLELVIDRLNEIAERSWRGITWLSTPEMLSEPRSSQFPNGYYDLGVAHVVPGIIAILGGACAAGVAMDKARPLLDGAVNWLLAQPVVIEPESFPYWIEPGKDPQAARLAWCYGDPGIAATLLCAARCVGESSWEQEALAIAHRAAERPLDRSGVVDAGLCHGAAGLGHIFNRIFQVTGEAWLKETARFWIGRALEMRHPGQGVAGYSSWDMVKEGKMDWVADPGFLNGAAGIALALLAATTTIEPAWDRIMLLSIPGQNNLAQAI